MSYENPVDLMGRLKIGREEFCQRLLTSLILGGPYPKWNSVTRPTERGLRFLALLFDYSFSDVWPGPCNFIDELDLPSRHDWEKGGAPDQAALWDDRLWMIELKTEKLSHRKDQIPHYFDLGGHHYPARAVDLTYLTPPMSAAYDRTTEGQRYSHVTWDEIAPLAKQVWGDEDEAASTLRGLLDAIEYMTSETPAQHRERLTVPPAEPVVPDALNQALELAHQTALDGEQRALEWRAPSLEDLHELRFAVRTAICASNGDSLKRVRPWLWRPESMGTPMTRAGAEVGFELRVSRYERPVCP